MFYVSVNSETTFDYYSPEIARKRADDISDDIPDTGKIPKNYFESFDAYWDTIFDYSTSEIDRQRSNDMSDDISDPVKILRVIAGIFWGHFWL